MKDRDFNDLLQSVKQAGSIHRKESDASRAFSFTPLDIKRIRESLSKTQAEFARMIGVSISTLRNWEQGRRAPDGPARALLRVAEQAPETVERALSWRKDAA